MANAFIVVERGLALLCVLVIFCTLVCTEPKVRPRPTESDFKVSGTGASYRLTAASFSTSVHLPLTPLRGDERTS